MLAAFEALRFLSRRGLLRLAEVVRSIGLAFRSSITEVVINRRHALLLVSVAVQIRQLRQALLGSSTVIILKRWNTNLAAVVVLLFGNALISADTERVLCIRRARLDDDLVAVVVRRGGDALFRAAAVVVVDTWHAVRLAHVVRWSRHAVGVELAVVVPLGVRHAVRPDLALVVFSSWSALWRAHAGVVVRGRDAVVAGRLVAHLVLAHWNAVRSASTEVVRAAWNTFGRGAAHLVFGSLDALRSSHTERVHGRRSAIIVSFGVTEIVGNLWNTIRSTSAVIVVSIRDAFQRRSAVVILR